MSLQEQIEVAREFALQKFPPLAMELDRNVVEIERCYAQAGSPDGPGNALSWFDSIYQTYVMQRELESEDVQNERKKIFQQGLELGDFLRVGEKFVITPKAVIRHLYYAVADKLADADEEQRGLDQNELISLRYHLWYALVELENSQERMTA